MYTHHEAEYRETMVYAPGEVTRLRNVFRERKTSFIRDAIEKHYTTHNPAVSTTSLIGGARSLLRANMKKKTYMVAQFGRLAS